MAIERKPAKRTRRPARSARQGKRTIWDELAEIGKRVPKKDRVSLPTDGARNFDHYVDGTPRD